ncbi:MAG TPA: glycosyltransferase family 39 protein [Pseudolabrys sp.]|nr:glycosyltransferase family 39 protein [Pseudolabrys sp.]
MAVETLSPAQRSPLPRGERERAFSAAGAFSKNNQAVADGLAILILAAVAIAAALTFRDYGLGWDDYTHSQYGDLLLKLYGSGFADTRALHFVNLYKYGGGFDMAAALAAKVLPFGLFETRRLMAAIVGLAGLIAAWRLARRLGGPVAGAGALALLATCPLYYGHMFMNAKDAPFAAAMILLLLGLVHVFEAYPKPGWRSIVLTGVALGLAFGSRVLAGLAAPCALAALALIAIVEGRADGWRPALRRLGAFLARFAPALLLAYAIMALLWPWSVVAPLNPLRAALYFDTFFEKPWKELYEGQLIPVPDMPATYLPHLIALKLPDLMLALGAAGIVGALVAVCRREVTRTRRANLLLVTLAVLLPVAIATITRPALYNGIRQFLFIVPPLAVLAGLAAGWLFERAAVHGRAALTAAAAVFAAGLSIPLYGMTALHPYEYVYYNVLAGGVRGAQGRYMLDYWGLAFKQAAEALRARLAAAGEHPPAGRRWVVAICGPQSSARQELGPEFETTFDQKKADFAMALGAFYCAHLQGPILAEIRRSGLVFATVYDLRGSPPPKLLTVPPP